MTYDELIQWANNNHGRGESDILFWYALSEGPQLLDMGNDEELAQMLVDGIKYDREYVKPLWDDLDEEDQNDYRNMMTGWWIVQDARKDGTS